jgi:protein gp37
VGELSVIEWTHSTLNFWRGCDKVDPTCAACYMFRDQRRYGRDPSVVVRCSDGTFYAPLRSRKWAETRERFLADFGYHLVFVCSWSDFFHEKADPWRADAWDVIRQTPQSTYQILTSRPERILERLPPDWGDGWPHVWMGVTIGNRRFVDRADLLRQVPAAVRFISAEPLLGPLVARFAPDGELGEWVWPDGRTSSGEDSLDLTGIDWLIVGGESGGRPGRRLVDERNAPLDHRIAWVRDLRDAAARSGTAFLFKQWGGPTPKSGGRELDGRTWDELPTKGIEPARRLALAGVTTIDDEEGQDDGT